MGGLSGCGFKLSRSSRVEIESATSEAAFIMEDMSKVKMT